MPQDPANPSLPTFMKSIQVVLVLYGRTLERSEAYISLRDAVAEEGFSSLDLLVFENPLNRETISPSIFSKLGQPEIKGERSSGIQIEWIHNHTNVGVSACYNEASKRASAKGKTWLLLLDQDFLVPYSYFRSIQEATSLFPTQSLFVPRLRSGQLFFSPFRWRWGLPRGTRKSKSGLLSTRQWGFVNSGMLVKTETFARAGGYEERAPLDFSDFFFWKAFSLLYPSFVLLPLELAHGLSTHERAGKDEKLRRFSFFCRGAFLFGARIGKPGRYAAWVWFRALKLASQFRSSSFLKVPLQALGAIAQSDNAHEQKTRTRVSVCMATCDGMKFLPRQMESILRELGPEDEIIVADASSIDGTVEYLKNLGDARIRILELLPRGRIPATFEAALKQARGEFVFLSDQDDEWVEGKIEQILKRLEVYDLVVSDCILVGSNDVILRSKTFFQIRKSRRGLAANLLKNRYMGCCMAFRCELLAVALPFPRNIPMHDQWIGLIGEIFGQPEFFPHVLVNYRRHGENNSSGIDKKGITFISRIFFRCSLILNICIRVKNVCFKGARLN